MLHRQHLLTCSSSPRWFSSPCGFHPPRGVLETLRNYMCSLSATPLPASIAGSRGAWEADKATSVGWKGRWALPALADPRYGVPFGVIIFNDKDGRALPAHRWVWLGSRRILSSKLLSRRESLFRWGCFKCSPSALTSLVPLLIKSSEGFFSCYLSSGFWSFTGCHAQAGEAGGSALQRWVPKSTNPPAILQGKHPTCFTLGLITCVYSFTEADWPFLWMVALQKAEEMTKTFSGICCLNGLYPQSGAWQVQPS